MARYYKSTATVWNNANSWSAISSIALDNAGIPSTTDDVIFDATSGIACAVSTSGAILIGNCRNLTTTGYTGTITLNVDLQVFGPTIIVANTTFAGTAWFIIGGQNPAVAKNMTSNGVYFPNFQLATGGPPSNTLTFNDVLNVGNIRQGLANGIVTNGSFVNVNNSMTMENANIGWSGTTVYNLVGTGNGNFGMSNTNAVFANTININKTGGTITFLTNIRLLGATFTYTAGAVNTTTNSSLFDLYGNNTVTSKNIGTGNEIVFNNVRGGAANINGITTLGSDMRASGNFTVAQVNGYSFNGNTIFIGGNILNPTALTNGGTSVMVMEGSSNATISGGNLTRNLTISKTGGATVTLLGNLTYGAAGVSLIMNTAVNFTANNTTVTLAGATLTINNPIANSFYNLIIPVSQVLTLSGATTRITSNLTLNGATTFTGTFGWDCNNLICSTAGQFNITLEQGVTYRTRTGVSITGGIATVARPTMRSSLANSYAIWTLDQGATQSLIYVNAIDIDSSQNNGQTIWSFGVIPLTNLVRTINWNPGVPLRTVAYTFVN